MADRALSKPRARVWIHQHGVAVSAAICGAEDPLAASREIVAAMDAREPSPGPGS